MCKNVGNDVPYERMSVRCCAYVSVYGGGVVCAGTFARLVAYVIGL